MNIENNENEKKFYDNGIEKTLYVESDLPWVNYLVIDEISFKRKLGDKAPKNIKESYFNYIVNNLVYTFSNLVPGAETSIKSLIETTRGISGYIFTNEDLKKIANLFFSKCNDNKIDLELKYENDKTIFDISFIKIC